MLLVKKEEIKQKIKLFLNDRINLLFLAVLLFGLILRLKYFTMNQALWYDEAEYLCIAKNWAYGLSYPVSILRPPLFPLFEAIAYKTGFGSELFFRSIELMFSIGSILLTYFLGKELYNKKVGLIASFLMSFFYEHLFYTARIMTEIPTLTLWLLSLYFFWKGYVKTESKKYLWLAAFVIALSTLIRYTGLMVGAVILIFLLFSERLNFLKKKEIWVFALIALLTLSPYLIWSYKTYGKIGFLTAGTGYGIKFNPFNYINLFNYIKHFSTYLYSPIPFLGSTIFQIFLILFLGGVGISLFNLAIGWDLIKKEESLKSDLFMIASILVPLLYFSKLPSFETRYLICIFPAVFFFTAKMLLIIDDYLKKYHKLLAIGIIGLILCLGAYHHIKFADNVIKNKATSFVDFRQAGEWIKQNSEPDNKIIGDGAPMIQYYSDRRVIGWGGPEENFLKYIQEQKPKYMLLSAVERAPDWAYTWPQNNPDKVVPVQAYFWDAEKTKPSLIIYQIKTTIFK